MCLAEGYVGEWPPRYRRRQRVLLVQLLMLLVLWGTFKTLARELVSRVSPLLLFQGHMGEWPPRYRRWQRARLGGRAQRRAARQRLLLRPRLLGELPSYPCLYTSLQYVYTWFSIHPCIHPSVLSSIYPSVHPSYLSIQPSIYSAP